MMKKKEEDKEMEKLQEQIDNQAETINLLTTKSLLRREEEFRYQILLVLQDILRELTALRIADEKRNDLLEAEGEEEDKEEESEKEE